MATSAVTEQDLVEGGIGPEGCRLFLGHPLLVGAGTEVGLHPDGDLVVFSGNELDPDDNGALNPVSRGVKPAQVGDFRQLCIKVKFSFVCIAKAHFGRMECTVTPCIPGVTDSQVEVPLIRENQPCLILAELFCEKIRDGIDRESEKKRGFGKVTWA